MSTVNGSGRCGRQSDGHPTRGHEQVVRFNGAATFQPRNAVLEAAKGRRINSFNGAATFQPRNATQPAMTRHDGTASMGPRLFSRGMEPATNPVNHLHHASMGPRLFSRGMITLSAWWISSWPLQWGRDFSAAECQSRDSECDWMTELQWGRDFSAAECASTTSSRTTSVCFNGAATFQPRNAHGRTLPLHIAAASMGPRLFSRGMRVVQVNEKTLKKLQWGRDFSAAECVRTGTNGA